MKSRIMICRSAAALLAAAACLHARTADAQEHPPGAVTIHAVEAEPLRFGAFFQGPNGGSVNILADGTRSVSGDIVAAGMGHLFGPAEFDVEGPPGTIVSILDGPDVQLRGSNGGTMTLRIGNGTPSAPFVIGAYPAARASVRIGGTLVVGPRGANPSGNYQGTFNIIFIEQ